MRGIMRGIMLWIMLAAWIVGVHHARADWTLVEERFYALTLAGKPCGRSHEKVEQDGDRIRTSGRIELRFSRMGEETAIEFASEFTETLAGAPIEARISQGGAESVRYVFGEGRTVTVERGAEREMQSPRGMQSPREMQSPRGMQSPREMRPLPEGEWLTPRAARAHVRARQAEGAAEIRYRTLDVQSGLVAVEITMTRAGIEKRTVLGLEQELIRYDVRNSLLPVPARELLDQDGTVIESATAIGLGDLVSQLATRAEADAAHRAARFDILEGTFIESKPIDDFLERRAITLVVQSKEGPIAALPDSGAQRVKRVDERTLRVEVDVRRGGVPSVDDEFDQRLLKPNEVIDSDSPKIVALLAQAKVPPSALPIKQADALRAFVARHVSVKNLESAFAKASEVAATRSGDCTEHAVLLAALLRAAGIPARVASGLVYVPSVGGRAAGWGWHLWTQALVNPPEAKDREEREWVDFDATQPALGPRFHPAHVVVATTDLGGGATDPAFARALSFLGTVTIELDLGDANSAGRTTPPTKSPESPSAVPAGVGAP